MLVDSSKCSEVLYSKKRLALQQQDRACECFYLAMSMQHNHVCCSGSLPIRTPTTSPRRIRINKITRRALPAFATDQWEKILGARRPPWTKNKGLKLTFYQQFSDKWLKWQVKSISFLVSILEVAHKLGFWWENHALPTLKPCLLCAVEVVRHWDEPIPLIFSSLHGAMICQGACTSQKVCPVACASHCPCCQCCSKEKFTSCSLWGL